MNAILQNKKRHVGHNEEQEIGQYINSLVSFLL